MAKERIVAIGLLTERDVEALGSNFARLWPVDETPCFSQLLLAIDEADRELWQARDASARRSTSGDPVNKVPNLA